MTWLYRLLLRLYPHRDYAGRRDWEAFCRFDIHTNGDLYLRRFVLLKTPWGGLYLHHIVRSDRDRCLHDHPWGFTSWILAGGYYEETLSVSHRAEDQDRVYEVPDPHPFPTRTEWRGPGSCYSVPACHVHRVQLRERDGCPVPAWSLVRVGRKERSWGFWSRTASAVGKRFGDWTWVPWKEFVSSDREC